MFQCVLLEGVMLTPDESSLSTNSGVSPSTRNTAFESLRSRHVHGTTPSAGRQ